MWKGKLSVGMVAFFSRQALLVQACVEAYGILLALGKPLVQCPSPFRDGFHLAEGAGQAGGRPLRQLRAPRKVLAGAHGRDFVGVGPMVLNSVVLAPATALAFLASPPYDWARAFPPPSCPFAC